MIPFTPSPRLAMGALAAALLLGLAGGISAWIGARGSGERTHEQRTETRTQTTATRSSEDEALIRQLLVQNAVYASQQTAQSRQQQDVATRTVERIERYLPSPASAPASPVVVVRDSAPVAVGSEGSAGPSLSRSPVEVITRTTESVDRSKIDTESASSSASKTDTRTETEGSKKTKESSQEESASTSKTVEKTRERRFADELPRFGVGYGSSGPFASYDLLRGPSIFGLERAAAGVFITKGKDGKPDGGPQGNLSLGKGKLQPFLLGGYQVREQEIFVGAGVKF